MFWSMKLDVKGSGFGESPHSQPDTGDTWVSCDRRDPSAVFIIAVHGS